MIHNNCLRIPFCLAAVLFATALSGCSRTISPAPEPIVSEKMSLEGSAPRINPAMVSSYMRSRIAMRLGDRRSAYQYLVTALQSDGDNPVLLGDLAAAALQLGRIEEAIEAARKSLRIQPHRIEVNEALAGALEIECRRKGADGPWEESLTARERLVELEPDNFRYRLKLGETAMHLKKWELAESSYQAASRLASYPGQMLHVRLSFGWLKIQEGKFTEAEEAFAAVLDENPHNWRAMVGIGLANRATGNPEKARVYLERALKARPGEAEVRSMLFDLYNKEELLPEAAEMAEKILKEKPDNYSLKLELGRIYMKMNEYEKAERKFDSLVEDRPDEAGYHYYHGLALWRSGRSGEAQAEFERTIRMAPERVEGWIHLGYILFDSNRYRQAADSLAKAPPEVQKHFEIRSIRATAAFQLRNYREAIDHAKAALRARKDYPLAMFYLAASYERSGKFDEAVKLFRRLVEDDPDNHQAGNYLGYMLAEKGVHLDESLQLVRKALQAEPDNGVYLDSLGWVYFKLGRLDEAVDTLERAVAQQPDPLIYEHLGDVYLEKQQVRKAYETYLKAREADGEDGDRIRKKVEELLRSIDAR